MTTITKYVTGIALMIYYVLEGLILVFIPKRFRYKDVSNETVLITGGGSGMGRLFALSFAQRGARVVLWDIVEKGNQETARLVAEIGGKCHWYICDITDREKVYRVAAKVKDEVGKITILVNNAGIVTGKQFLDCPDEKIEATFKVNAISHFWLLKAFLPDMMESNHGHIVSVSSMAGITGVPGLSDYCAAKYAAVGLEESLRFELQLKGYTGIHSTVVCPYYTNTGMFYGVSTGLLPLLEPADVVNEAMAAILVNQPVVLLPKICNFLVVCKTIFPAATVVEALKLLGITESMASFQGRK